LLLALAPLLKVQTPPELAPPLGGCSSIASELGPSILPDILSSAILSSATLSSPRPKVPSVPDEGAPVASVPAPSLDVAASSVDKAFIVVPPHAAIATIHRYD
jgi:hypothetical protein